MKRISTILLLATLGTFSSEPAFGQGSWTLLLEPDTIGYFEPFFLDQRNGWIAFVSRGSRGIVRTRDGGTTWDTLVGRPQSGTKMFFVDTNTGWSWQSSGGNVHRTADGGRTWVEITSSFPEGPSGKLGPQALHFSDPDTGWAACSYAVLLKTTDGGDSWLPESPMIADHWRSFRDIYFVDETYGWAVGGDRVDVHARTTDGGATWLGSRFDISLSCCRRNAVSFGDRTWGIAVGDRYLSQTFDGGGNWERLDSFGPDHSPNRVYLIDVDLVDTSYGWVAGYYQDSAANPVAAFVSITSDRGKTWQHHEFPSLAEGVSSSVLGLTIGISVLSRSRGLLIGGSPGSVLRYDLSSDVPSEQATGVRKLDLRP